MTTTTPPLVLLTGVTGFLGGAVLYELLGGGDEHEALEGDVRVVVVARARGGRSARERVETLLRRWIPENIIHKVLDHQVLVVEGSLDDALLWTRSDLVEFTGQVTHIIHTAASVSFDEPLPAALRSNTMPTLALYEYARQCTRLQCLLHVSTAYVARSRGGLELIPPEPVHLDPAIVSALTPLVGLTTRAFPESAVPTESATGSEADSEEIVAGAESSANTPPFMLLPSLKEHSVSKARDPWQAVWESVRGYHPNTYTFSKALTEHLLTERHTSARAGAAPPPPFSLVIVRPSIISLAENAQARAHGKPNFAALNGILALAGSGYLHTLHAMPDHRLNVVPVDGVARTVVYCAGLAAAVKLKIPSMIQCVTETSAESSTSVRHGGSTLKTPMPFEAGVGEEQPTAPEIVAWKDSSKVTIVHATSDVPHSLDIELMMRHAGPIFMKNRAPGLLGAFFLMRKRRDPVFHLVRLLDRVQLVVLCWLAPASKAHAVANLLNSVDAIHNEKSSIGFFVRQTYNLTPSPIAMQVGLLAYDPEEYCKSLCEGISSNLQKKRIVVPLASGQALPGRPRLVVGLVLSMLAMLCMLIAIALGMALMHLARVWDPLPWKILHTGN